LPTIRRQTHLPVAVAEALSVSLDLDVELVAGARWHARALRGGEGFRTAGVIGRGEMVRWSMRVWGVVPVRHTSRIVSLVEDDARSGASFVDEMTSGIFASYRHVHTFRLDGSGTAMTDDVTWRSLGPLALADTTIVRRTLLRLLEQRNAEIVRRLT
jgi:hypothetical protein